MGNPGAEAYFADVRYASRGCASAVTEVELFGNLRTSVAMDDGKMRPERKEELVRYILKFADALYSNGILIFDLPSITVPGAT